MTEPASPTPADVFGGVADETILRTLAEAPYDEYRGTLTFIRNS
ncbi:hypothetical protein [Halorussus lipolyticus]|nr:hypothetical protein [Halorussus sp. DT80]